MDSTNFNHLLESPEKKKYGTIDIETRTDKFIMAMLKPVSTGKWWRTGTILGPGFHYGWFIVPLTLGQNCPIWVYHTLNSGDEARKKVPEAVGYTMLQCFSCLDQYILRTKVKLVIVLVKKSLRKLKMQCIPNSKMKNLLTFWYVGRR